MFHRTRCCHSTRAALSTEGGTPGCRALKAGKLSAAPGVWAIFVALLFGFAPQGARASTLTITCSNPPLATFGTAYSATPCTASGGSPPYTWWNASTLPTGLSINSATGQISGVPGGIIGTYSPINIEVYDSTTPTPQLAAASISLTVSPSPITFTCSAPPNGTVGVAYSATPCTASGGTLPYTWFATGVLPPGLSINTSTGAITGTPTTATESGQDDYATIGVTDSAVPAHVNSGAIGFVILPASLILTCTTSPAGRVGTAFASALCAANGGTSPYSWSASGLPPGLSINLGTGAVSGTPTATGSYPVTITVADSSTPTRQSASQQVTITINPSGLSVTCTAPPAGTVGVLYSWTTCAIPSGGTPPYSWSWSPALPPGLSENTASWIVAGTPTTAGSYPVTLNVKDSSTPALTYSQQFTIVINPGALTANCSPPPTGTVGIQYSWTTCTASGGTPPYSWSAPTAIYGGTVSGLLPPGLSLNSANGSISGTPTAAGSYSIGLLVGDSSTPKQTVSLPFTIVINAVQLTANCGTPPNGTVRIYYSWSTCAASGGTTPYAWSASGLPPGLSITSGTGAVSGTPTKAGFYSVTLLVTDSSTPTPQTFSQQFTMVINPGSLIVTCTEPPVGTVGVAYSWTICTASGSLGPFTWSLTGAPAWMTIDSTGTISGTPTAAASYTFTVSVLDTSTNATKSAQITIVINSSTFTASCGAPPAGTVGTAYSWNACTATGGAAPYTWSWSGSLPPGLSLIAATGAVSGTPTAAGSYAITITVTDNSTPTKQTNSQEYTIPINSAGLTANCGLPPGGTVGTAYSWGGCTVSGGTAPYTWSETGALPPGLSFNGNGAVSGTPTTAGSYTLTVTVTDSTAPTKQTNSQQITITISSSNLTITWQTPAAGTVGTAYTWTPCAVNGGTPSYTWTWSGTLPPGLSMSPTTGVVSGTPTTAGSYSVGITVTDSTSPTKLTGSSSFTLTINAEAPLAVSCGTLPGGTVGMAYSANVCTSSGGIGPYTWTWSGTTPPGLSINSSNGQISGTPTAIGSYPDTITATDNSSPIKLTKSQAITIVITAPPVQSVSIAENSSSSAPNQTNLSVAFAQPAAANYSGTLTASFAPDPGVSGWPANTPPDPAAGFPSGLSGNSLTQNFTMGQNQTQTTAMPFALGTVAGTWTIKLTALDGGVPSPAPTSTIQVALAAPVIMSGTVTITFNSTNTGFTVGLSGFATSRDVASSSFVFTAASGDQLTGAGTPVVVASNGADQSEWFNTSAGRGAGGVFSLSVPFTYSGNPAALASVAVTLTNAKGQTSTAVTGVQ